MESGGAPPVRLSDTRELVDGLKAVLLDCDGVLWRGGERIEGSFDTLRWLREKGVKLYFVTNNSTKSRRMYSASFERFGFPVDAADIFSSSYAVAAYLKSIEFGGKAYVIGEQGICEELEEAGIEWYGSQQHAHAKFEESSAIEVDEEVKAVVVGFDRSINYYKVSYATVHLLGREQHCMFVASNTDSTYPAPGNKLLPGTGTIVASVAEATSRKPVVTGKPSAWYINHLLKHKLDIADDERHKVLMVGDRLNTDVLFGKQGGIPTLLLTKTGVESEESMRKPENAHMTPSYYTERLSDLKTLYSSGSAAAPETQGKGE